MLRIFLLPLPTFINFKACGGSGFSAQFQHSPNLEFGIWTINGRALCGQLSHLYSWCCFREEWNWLMTFPRQKWSGLCGKFPYLFYSVIWLQMPSVFVWWNFEHLLSISAAKIIGMIWIKQLWKFAISMDCFKQREIRLYTGPDFHVEWNQTQDLKCRTIPLAKWLVVKQNWPNRRRYAWP